MDCLKDFVEFLKKFHIQYELSAFECIETGEKFLSVHLNRWNGTNSGVYGQMTKNEWVFDYVSGELKDIITNPYYRRKEKFKNYQMIPVREDL